MVKSSSCLHLSKEYRRLQLQSQYSALHSNGETAVDPDAKARISEVLARKASKQLYAERTNLVFLDNTDVQFL